MTLATVFFPNGLHGILNIPPTYVKDTHYVLSISKLFSKLSKFTFNPKIYKRIYPKIKISSATHDNHLSAYSFVADQ